MNERQGADYGLTDHKVKPLELFFDLVFVLAFTQVTTKLSEDLTWQGFGRSMLVLAVLWWAWAGFAWLTNAFDPESKLLRLPIFIAIAVLLIVSLAVPEAFGEYALIFAVGYLIVRLIHVSFYLIGARGNAEHLHAVLRMSPAFAAAPLILLASTAFDGEVQAAIWILAIVVDYGGAYVLGGDGWQISPEHFAERFGLIVLIALGESIVSIGVGATGVELDFMTMTGAVVGVVIASALWWMYFDVVALVASRVLESKTGVDRIRLARDTYAVLHLFVIAGIILMALAIKKTIGHPEEHLKEIPAYALGIGAALYAGTLSAIRKRDVGAWNWFRLAIAALTLALIPLFKELDSIASISIVAAILVVVTAIEATYYRDVRARVRSGA